jgi:hypothetical protein
MKFILIVKPNAKHTRVERVSDTELKVWVNAPAKEGKANAAAVKAAAEFFGIAPSRVRIVSGHTAKKKLFDIA